jgi:hypothetical protein
MAEDINLGARPDVLPYVKLEAVEFKVTNPTAADPTAPVRMLFINQRFTMHFIVKLSGIWRGLFNGSDEAWETHFYADSLGVDVAGELRWDPARAPLPTHIAFDDDSDTYDLNYTVLNGLPTEGLYELGAMTRLPGMLVNAFVEGYHIEIAER